MSHAHRVSLTVGLVALVTACSADAALTGIAADELAGTWSQSFSIPGPSTVIALAVADTTVAGTGTFAIEAGRSGTITVTGKISSGATVDLDLTRSDGWIAHFRGTLVTRDSLDGFMWGHPTTTTIGVGDPVPASFHRVAIELGGQ